MSTPSGTSQALEGLLSSNGGMLIQRRWPDNKASQDQAVQIACDLIKRDPNRHFHFVGNATQILGARRSRHNQLAHVVNNSSEFFS